jgi:hypothetical protein
VHEFDCTAASPRSRLRSCRLDIDPCTADDYDDAHVSTAMHQGLPARPVSRFRCRGRSVFGRFPTHEHLQEHMSLAGSSETVRQRDTR